jgi:hypothetical protein
MDEREKLLKEARELGIVDVEGEKISLETLKLAVELTKKHAPKLYERLEKRRKAQKTK